MYMSSITKNVAIYAERGSCERMVKEVLKATETLLQLYGGFLTETDIIKAKALTWGVITGEEYMRRFRIHVLMDSYKVWESSHLRYPELLKIVAANNPEWIEGIIKDHDEKIKRCKVCVFPLGEAQTA